MSRLRPAIAAEARTAVLAAPVAVLPAAVEGRLRGEPMSVLSVRWRDGGMEARCPLCEDYLPTTEEYWNPRGGVTRCRACWAEYFRLHQLGYTDDEAVRRCRRMKNKLAYAVTREARCAYNRRYKATHVERVAAYNAARRALIHGDPAPMAQYHADWPDARLARRPPVLSVEEQRRQWRDARRRSRAAA